MPRYQYQGTPAIPPAPTVQALSGGTITVAKAGTYYFWLQYRNRAGYSLVSASSSSVTVAAGQKIRITIPGGARPSPDGTDIQEYVVIMHTSDSAAGAKVAATFPGYQADGTPYSLPAQIELDRDSHLDPGATVANVAALPASPVHGQRRYISDIDEIRAYDAIFTPTGWKNVYPEVLNTYINSAIGEYGANADLTSNIDEANIIKRAYAVDGSLSKPVGFWLVNDGTTAISKGTRIGIKVAIGGVDVTSLGIMAGLIKMTFKGFANTTTGVKDTTGEGGVGLMGVDAALDYTGEDTSFVLEKDLPAGSAYILEVQLQAAAFNLQNRGAQGAGISFLPFFFTNFAIYNPAADYLGSAIFAVGDRRRVVPNGPGLVALALGGQGQINTSGIGGYIFPELGEQSVTGLLSNTANQKVVITPNGTCYVSTTVPATTGLRALVGTVNGRSVASSFAGSLSLNTTTRFTIQITYPTTIAADYPDVIAGSDKGEFNATNVIIFVRPVGGGTIREFTRTITPGVASETFTVGDDSGVSPASLPAPATDFALFRPAAGYVLNTTAGASPFSTGTYEVAIAYEYNNTVTSISHDYIDNGCIYELDANVTEVLAGGSVGNAKFVKLVDVVAAPSTTADQVALYQDGGVLKVREKSNGVVHDIVIDIREIWLRS